MCASLVQAAAAAHRTQMTGREFCALSLHGMKTAKSIAPQT
jgi:hypothetical protein